MCIFNNNSNIIKINRANNKNNNSYNIYDTNNDDDIKVKSNLLMNKFQFMII